MIRRAHSVLVLLLVLLSGSFAKAAEIIPFDAYSLAKPVAPPFPSSRAPGGFVASIDTQRGTPTFFWAARGVALPAALSGAPSERVALHHLAAHARRWGLTPASLGTARAVLVHDTGRGGVVVVFRQELDGVELIRADMKVLMARTGELVAISGGSKASTCMRGSPCTPAIATASSACAGTARDLRSAWSACRASPTGASRTACASHGGTGPRTWS